MRRLVALLALIAACVAVAGCGGGHDDKTVTPLDDALGYFSRDAPFVAAVETDPDGPQIKQLRQLVGRFPGGDILRTRLQALAHVSFARWDRGPNEPSQAVLVDLVNRRFYFFFIELWPQEVYYFTGLLIIAAFTLFLMNALAGRVWCGYLCPQTVWTDLFMMIERLVEGDRRERMAKDQGPWTVERVIEKALKHSMWLLIAWWTGGAWVLYFADAPTLVKQLATFQAPMIAYVWIAILTTTTYFLAGYMREQVCVYMCPWPRIQAALTDEWALNVTYRYDRGEARTSLKKAKELRAEGKAVGDCIDCYQCVAVCPTGIDIRDGAQMDCIQCGLCIDACDTVMEKIGDPLVHLVRNALDHGLESPAEREAAGKPTTGTLTISAQHAGGNVIITVSDDGRGIDPRRVAEKAAERGLIGAEAVDAIDMPRAVELLFSAGFSTADVTSDISGRGGKEAEELAGLRRRAGFVALRIARSDHEGQREPDGCGMGVSDRG